MGGPKSHPEWDVNSVRMLPYSSCTDLHSRPLHSRKGSPLKLSQFLPAVDEESTRLLWFPTLGCHTLGDVNTLSDEFRPHVLAALAYYSLVPSAFTVRQLVE